MENSFPSGNEALIALIRRRPFDREQAEEIIKKIGNVNHPIQIYGDGYLYSDKTEYSTTYLHEACDYDNLEAVRLLFEYGADPNYENPELDREFAFWNLMYGSESESEEENRERYKIAELFFEYGADPNTVSKEDGENFYYWVLYHEPNDMDSPNGRYEMDFFGLLSREKEKADKKFIEE